MEKAPPQTQNHSTTHHTRMDGSVAISRVGIGAEVIRERYHGLNMHVLSYKSRQSPLSEAALKFSVKIPIFKIRILMLNLDDNHVF